MKYSKI